MFFSKTPSNGVQSNGNIETQASDSGTTTMGKRSFQSNPKSKFEIVMQSKVAFVLVCIVVMWIGIGMGKFVM